MAKKRQIVKMMLLPSEPLNETGRVCIHLVVEDEKGSFVEPHMLHPVYEDGVQVKQKLEARPTQARLACNPTRTVVPKVKGGVTAVTCRTDDPRAVTCPRCISSKEYTAMMAQIQER